MRSPILHIEREHGRVSLPPTPIRVADDVYDMRLYKTERKRKGKINLAVLWAGLAVEDMTAFRNRFPEEPQGFIELVEPVFGQHLTPGIRQRLLLNDFAALRALTQDRPSLADALANISMPCMVFVGETDPRFPMVKQCVKQLPSATFFTLPDCDHVAALGRSELVLPHIRRFLAKFAQ